MSTTIKDANVEDFLDRVRELDERRTIEDELRRRRLKEEVALKKKRLAIGNKSFANNENNPFDSDDTSLKVNEDLEIQLARPVLKQTPETQREESYMKTKPTVISHSPPSSSHSPSLYKYKDTLDVNKTIERLIGRRPKVASTRSRIPSDSSIIVIDSSSSDEEELPPLPTRKEEELLPPLPKRRDEETPPKLPARKEQPIITKKPEVPKKKLSSFDSISQKDKHEDNGVYIPRPNPIAVMSATAAARAPQLMRNTVDSSIGERSPDLKEKAKFLSASSVGRKSHGEDGHSKTANIHSPQRASWLNSALNHSGTTKQSIPSTETKIKMKPLVPNKPNSLIVNSEKLKEEAQRDDEISKALAEPTLKHLNTKQQKKEPIKPKPSVEFKRPELKSATSLGIQQNTHLLSYSEPEALQSLSRLRSPSPVHKPVPQEPEALQSISKLKTSSPVRKPAPEEPEALKKAGKLKPVVPAKKPDVETFELLKKLSALKRNENSPMNSSPTKKNFEQENLELLQKSMTGLKKSSFTKNSDPVPARQAALPRRTQTETLSPVRLPFTDPNAVFPTIIRPKTFDSSELSSEKESKKLNHVTKTRTKGPKRRLPKNLLSEEPQKIEDFKIRGKKNAPPPIKSSSRLVSNKLEKRIFSNSELFI